MLFARITVFLWAASVCLAPRLDAAAPNDTGSTQEALKLVHQGSLAERDGSFLQASNDYERAAAMLEHSRGPNDGATVNVLHRLADASINLGRYAKAERLLQRVLLAREAMTDADAALTAKVLNDLALVYIAQHRPQQAEPLVRRALAIFERAPAGHEIEVASTWNTMAWVVTRAGRLPEGIDFARRAQILLATVHAPPQDRIDNFLTLASLHAGAGHPDEAADYARRSVETAAAAFGPDHFRTALAQRLYAAVLRRQKRNREAKAMEKQAAKTLMEMRISPSATIDITALRGASQ